MKRLLLSLLAAGVLAVPAPAFALRTQTAYDVTSPDGPIDASDIGIAVFDLDADLGSSCRYYMEWVGPDSDDQWDLVDCWLDERKVHGAASCFVDSASAFPTILVNDPALACAAYNTVYQVAPVIALVLGESLNGSLYGVVQYAPSTTLFDAIELDPYP